MRILLTGASGFLGRNIAGVLAAAGHEVRPISRSTGVDFCTMIQPDDWIPHLAGIDAVINSVGIIGEHGSQKFEPIHSTAPIALFRACVPTGIRRVVQISALGADEAAFSRYHLSKRAADDTLRSLDLDWFVLRPSLVYGRDGASSRLFMQLAALPLIPVVGDGLQQVQPVHVRDVADTVARCLTYGRTRQTLDVVGGQSLTFRDWLDEMRRTRGLPPGRFVRIPVGLAMAGACLGGWLSPMLRVENVRMLQTGYVSDAKPIAELLGRPVLRPEPRLFFSDALSGGRTS